MMHNESINLILIGWLKWVYQILSISSTLWLCAQVLRFTNLTSDTLSLYQDPQNAGAVFQAFGCLWNDNGSMSEDNDHGLGISWPWTTWQPPALWKGWLSLWLVLDMVILIWHGQIISWIWEYDTMWHNSKWPKDILKRPVKTREDPWKWRQWRQDLQRERQTNDFCVEMARGWSEMNLDMWKHPNWQRTCVDSQETIPLPFEDIWR